MSTLNTAYAPWGRIESELFREISELLRGLEELYSEAGLTERGAVSNSRVYRIRHAPDWYTRFRENATTVRERVLDAEAHILWTLIEHRRSQMP
jgi:hypothetical protein